MTHPCELIYNIAKDPPVYGDISGICRITGKEGKGLLFDKWVKDTFTDHAYLKPGTIVCNEALFTFDEKNEFLQALTKRDKPQKFRTYSHFVIEGEWYVFTKANKREMFHALTEQEVQIAIMSDSGQKHLFFKYRYGFWQLEEQFIIPAPEQLKDIHATMQELLLLGFTQKEVISGNYETHRIVKAGIDNWKRIEDRLKPVRGNGIFDVASWLLFTPENSEEHEPTEPERPFVTTGSGGQISLFTI